MTEATVKSLDRIFIGGLDPPRLTAQDVLNRLPADKNVEIQSVESHAEKPYCHVTAGVTTGEISAYEVIFKTFNNVKWKGCRLVVQEARPHFLERLQQEIKERKERNSLEEPENPRITPTESDSKLDEKEAKEESSSKIPRRLRIRKKFGDEAYHVDTKPWFVDNWTNFRRAREKLEKRISQKREQEKVKRDRDTIPTPVMHRAVHILFEKEGNSSAPGGDASSVNSESSNDDSSLAMNDNDESSSLAETSDSEVSVDSDTLSQDETQLDAKADKKTPSYAWSDDDDDNDDGTEDRSRTVAMKHGEQKITSFATASKDSDDKMELDEVRVDPIQEVSAQRNTASYQWSSDEGNSSSDDEEEDHKDRSGPLRQVSQSDEFATGFMDEGFLNGNDDDESADDLPTAENALVGNTDLRTDVSTNLGILSSLFPDIDGIKPQSLDNDSELSEGRDEEKARPQTGFGKSGMMLRYDPNDSSMQQFEIEEEGEKEIEESNKSQSESDGDDDSEMDTEAPLDPENAEADASHVYEEKKLENVFRQARDAWNADEVKEKAESTGGGFSFGFDLGDTEPAASAEPAGGFSFGFDLSQAEPSEQPVPDTHPGATSEPLAIESEPKIPERRIRGPRFPDDLLAKYTADFFAMNQTNLDPEEDKEAWKRERQTLTLDWKRKRKHAQSRIQKRMKVR